jgi:GT2 family glycosyltransferase
MRMQEVPPGIVAALGLWNLMSRLCRWGAGAFLFCRSDAFRAIGGFGLDFFAAEELDLSRRIKRWGRARGLVFRILHRHPMLTSGRKGRLYSYREIGVLFLTGHRAGDGARQKCRWLVDIYSDTRQRASRRAQRLGSLPCKQHLQTIAVAKLQFTLTSAEDSNR